MDYIICDGTIVDGTGQPAFRGDIGIKDGVIVAIGAGLVGEGKVIDAKGCIVTPGFIDVHTHYDGQATWDDALEPSASHGVTTLIMGNCGVGFAPMHAGDRDQLIDLMEGVEDIPGTALFEGMPWGAWESFPEYLDFLGTRSYAMDIGAQIPHGALRFYVMGERGMRNEDATEADVREMAALTQEAMTAGAVGFTSSRTVFHRSRKEDLPTPGTYASRDEIYALMEAVAASGRGVVELIPSGVGGDGDGALQEYSDPLAEAELFGELSRITGVPVTFSMVQSSSTPDYWDRIVACAERMNANGGKLYPQISARAVTVLHGLGSFHLFMHRPSYKKIAHLPIAERAAEMRKPEVKQVILAETDAPMCVPEQFLVNLFRRCLTTPWLFPMGKPVDFEPHPDTSLSARAVATGADPASLLYDTLLEDDGKAYHMALLQNYSDGNLDATRGMILHPDTVIGLGDGGAHVTFVSDASNTTFALSHWAVKRNRGPCIPIERIVAKLTANNADLYGLRDRGRIAVGQRADINVIDLDRLAVMPPRLVNDLPADGARLQQDATGYVATFVAGCITRRNDRDTGARPGRLVRSTAH